MIVRRLPLLALALTLAFCSTSPGRAASEQRWTLTPSTGRGPFFPVDGAEGADNDLRAVNGGGRAAVGVPLRIEGRVVDPAGAPVAEVGVVLWQVDAAGNYNHPDEATSTIKQSGDGRIDPRFQYRGRTRTDDAGAFVFETIVPAHYRAMGVIRPNHVHFEFRREGYRRLATEMNFRGDENFAHDFVTGDFGPEQLAALQVELEDLDAAPGAGHKLARWTVVLTPNPR